MTLLAAVRLSPTDDQLCLAIRPTSATFCRYEHDPGTVRILRVVEPSDGIGPFVLLELAGVHDVWDASTFEKDFHELQHFHKGAENQSLLGGVRIADFIQNIA